MTLFASAAAVVVTVVGVRAVSADGMWAAQVLHIFHGVTGATGVAGQPAHKSILRVRVHSLGAKAAAVLESLGTLAAASGKRDTALVEPGAVGEVRAGRVDDAMTEGAHVFVTLPAAFPAHAGSLDVGFGTRLCAVELCEGDVVGVGA